MMNARTRIIGRPIRIVLLWQLLATAALALLAGFLAGAHGAVSAALGGAVSMGAGAVAAIVAARGRAQSAGGVVVNALAAEGLRIGLMVLLLGVALATYREVVALALFGSFFVTVLIFAMAFFVREYE
jgi:ATP synthase protein I